MKNYYYEKFGWIQYIYLFEGIAMILTGPFILIYPEIVLNLYKVNTNDSIAANSLHKFGSLVFLMGWIETRSLGKLKQYEVEAWLIADILYLIALYIFIENHGEWNFWSFVASTLFPIIWAPIRIYWLYLNNKNNNINKKKS